MMYDDAWLDKCICMLGVGGGECEREDNLVHSCIAYLSSDSSAWLLFYWCYIILWSFCSMCAGYFTTMARKTSPLQGEGGGWKRVREGGGRE